jgi:hypothetical protein
MAYVKLDCGILNSTLWVDRESREVFITALLMAEPKEYAQPIPQYAVRDLSLTGWQAPPGWYGFVPAAGVGIINRAGISRDAGLDALERLGSPEAESRSNDFDGRRMIRVNGGYLLLNYMRYRDMDHSAAERQRRLRARRALAAQQGLNTPQQLATSNGVTVTDSNVVTRDGNPVARDSNADASLLRATSRIADADADADADAEVERERHPEEDPSAAKLPTKGKPRGVVLTPDATNDRSVTNAPEWTMIQALYPKRSGDQPWKRAARAANARLKDGATWTELIDGTTRYQTFCRETGKTGTEYVMQAARFFGPDRPYLQLWHVTTKADARLDANLQAVAEFMHNTEPTDAH